MSVAAEPASGSLIAMAMVTSPDTHFGQVGVLLLLGAEELQHPDRADVGLEDLERRGPALLGQLLLHDQRVEERAAVAAVLLGDGDAEEAQAGQPLHLVVGERGALEVPFSGERRVAIAGDLGGQLAQLVLLGGQLKALHVGSPSWQTPETGAMSG